MDGRDRKKPTDHFDVRVDAAVGAELEHHVHDEEGGPAEGEAAQDDAQHWPGGEGVTPISDQ